MHTRLQQRNTKSRLVFVQDVIRDERLAVAFRMRSAWLMSSVVSVLRFE